MIIQWIDSTWIYSNKRKKNNIWFSQSFRTLVMCVHKKRIIKNLHYYLFSIPAWVHLDPRWSSRSTDRKCLLGTLLSRARYPTWWSDAVWQDHWRWRRLLQHLFQWDWSGKTRSQGSVRGFRANSCRWVSLLREYCVFIISKGVEFRNHYW